MGRTFGLIIVSIGLWLVFSLPTRAPSSDQLGATIVNASTETSAKPTLPAVAPAQLTSVVIPASRTLAIRPATNEFAGHARTSRTLDERNLAARSREIESEPDAAVQRAPEPVAVPILASRLFAAGASQNSPTIAEQAIPAPSPVMRSGSQAKVKLEPRNQDAEVSPLKSSPSLSTPTLPVAAAIKAPRIFDVVRRDLAAPRHAALAVKPDMPVQASPPASNKTNQAPAANVGIINKVRVPGTTSPENGFGTTKAPSSAKHALDVAAATRDVQVKKSSASKSANPATAKPAPRIAAAPASPSAPSFPPQRVRMAQVYSPPAYVGRVVARSSPPPAFVIPSSGSSRRSQFRGEFLWDSIRRGGM